MDWLTDPFALAFQQRALLGGALAAVATSALWAPSSAAASRYTVEDASKAIVPRLGIRSSSLPAIRALARALCR